MTSAFRWSLENGMQVRRFGSGPEVVWIHGLGEWSLSFDAVARHPALDGFTHVLPDLPGHGRSAWPPDEGAGGEALSDLADVLADWLSRRPPAVLIGHSMGGVLATLAAERTAVRGVVDVDGNLSRGDCVFSAEAARYTAEDFVAHGLAAMREHVFADARENPALRLYHGALCLASPHAFHRNATDLVRLSTEETLAARLAALSVPTLFVAGVPDGICARSRALLDEHRVRWIGITPAGHWVYVDQKDAFASAVASFLHEACPIP